MHAPEHGINFVVEMVEDDGGTLVFLEGLPWVDHQVRGSLLGGECAHVHSMGGDYVSLAYMNAGA